MAAKIKFLVSIGSDDWKPKIGAWECSALKIPGASIGAIYANGEKIDDKYYTVDTDHFMIRPAVPFAPSGFTAEVKISGGLRSKSSSWFGASIAAVVGAIAGVILTAIVNYYSPTKIMVSPSPSGGSSVASGADQPGGKAKPLEHSAPEGMTLPGQWASLSSHIEWRLKFLSNHADKLAMTLEVRNTEPSSQQWFYDFKKNPLAVIDSNGTFHEMMNTSDPPNGVQVEAGWPGPAHWVLQGGRVLELVAAFQPLAKGTTDGRVLYKNENHAEPLTFSAKPF